MTQSWSSQTSIFEGFISFVRVFLCKSYIVDKESGCSGFDSCVKYKSAFPSFFLLLFFFSSSDSALVARVCDKTRTKLKFLNVITHPKQAYGNHDTSLQVINVKNNSPNNKSIYLLNTVKHEEQTPQITNQYLYIIYM